MAKFIAVTGKGEEWTTLINFDHVARIDPFAIKGKPGAQLTFADGDTMTVQEDFETLAGMLEAIRA